jgi:methyl coenzyme M reductase subunit D
MLDINRLVDLLRHSIFDEKLSERVQAMRQALSLITPEEKRAIGISGEREAKLEQAHKTALCCEREEELLWMLKKPKRPFRICYGESESELLKDPLYRRLVKITEVKFDIQMEIGDIWRRIFDYFEDVQGILARIKP